MPSSRFARVLIAGSGPLSRVPPAVALLVVAALFAAGVIIGGITGAILLGLLVLGVALLIVATWAQRTPGERTGRIGILLLLIAITIARGLQLHR